MDCLFCKIVKDEVSAVKVWQDEKHLAIFDIFPNTRGMTLVLTKEHFGSDVFSMPLEEVKELSAAAKKVSDLLKKGLAVDRIAMVMEGTGIDHAHIKLYPMHKGEAELTETGETVYFNVYPGYISTQPGPKADLEDLKKLAEEIKGIN